MLPALLCSCVMEEVTHGLLLMLVGLPALEANNLMDKDSPFYYGGKCRCKYNQKQRSKDANLMHSFSAPNLKKLFHSSLQVRQAPECFQALRQGAQRIGKLINIILHVRLCQYLLSTGPAVWHSGHQLPCCVPLHLGALLSMDPLSLQGWALRLPLDLEAVPKFISGLNWSTPPS
ncbi:hypothetical protein MC885_015449 [Smutsia gigantea]|nr:hypothetical protein MC885_015449 [Smutsia gigantea]